VFHPQLSISKQAQQMKSEHSLLWLTKVCFLSWLHVVQIVLCWVRHSHIDCIICGRYCSSYCEM